MWDFVVKVNVFSGVIILIDDSPGIFRNCKNFSVSFNK